MKNTRIINGYRVIYKPNHETSMKSANWEGYVYEHVYLIETSLGRLLRDDEEVHHLDGNKANNRLENLIVLEKSMHLRLHKWIEKGCLLDTSNKAPKTCKVCGTMLQNTQILTCSNECKSKIRVSKKPSKNILEEDIRTLSWVAIGRKYGVSDNAVRKWARSYHLI